MKGRIVNCLYNCLWTVAFSFRGLFRYIGLARSAMPLNSPTVQNTVSGHSAQTVVFRPLGVRYALHRHSFTDCSDGRVYLSEPKRLPFCHPIAPAEVSCP